MKSSWWVKPRGGAGWLAITGMAVGVTAWWPLAAVATGGWVALAIRGVRRGAKAMDHLAAAFADAKRSGTFGQLLEGVFGDMPFQVRNTSDVMQVLVATPIPRGVTIDRASGLPTGDPEFDTRFRVVANDSDCEVAWRVMLAAEQRARWCALFDGVAVSLHDGWLDIVIDDDEADGPAIERLMRDGIALAVDMYNRYASAYTVADFVEQIPREPFASVRMTHYEWLVTGGYEVPALLRLASEDADPEIRAWAQSQRPSETLYR